MVKRVVPPPPLAELGRRVEEVEVAIPTAEIVGAIARPPPLLLLRVLDDRADLMAPKSSIRLAAAPYAASFVMEEGWAVDEAPPVRLLNAPVEEVRVCP